MPTPKTGESRSEYMGRCVPQVMGEGLTNEQAVGKCEGMYSSHANKEMEDAMRDTLNNPTAQGAGFHASLEAAIRGELRGGDVLPLEQGQGDPVIEKAVGFDVPSQDPLGLERGGLTLGDLVEKDMSRLEQDLTAAGGGAPLIPQHLGHEVKDKEPPDEAISARGGQGGREALVQPTNRVLAKQIHDILVGKAEEFEPPPSGGHSEHEKAVLSAAYTNARKQGYNKERAAKIAWGAVNNLANKDDQMDLLTRLRIADELQEIMDLDPYEEISTDQPAEATPRKPGAKLSRIQDQIPSAHGGGKDTSARKAAMTPGAITTIGAEDECDPKVEKELRHVAANMAVAMKDDLAVLAKLVRK